MDEFMMGVDDAESLIEDLKWVIKHHQGEHNFCYFEDDINDVIKHLEGDIYAIENYVEPSDFNDDCCGGYPRYSDNIVAGY